MYFAPRFVSVRNGYRSLLPTFISVSKVRIVCKNVTHILRRKDSTGSFLSTVSSDAPTALAASSSATTTCDRVDYNISFRNEKEIRLNPGKNRVFLNARAGPETGTYTLQQMSAICFQGKLDILSDMSR